VEDGDVVGAKVVAAVAIVVGVVAADADADGAGKGVAKGNGVVTSEGAMRGEGVAAGRVGRGVANGTLSACAVTGNTGAALCCIVGCTAPNMVAVHSICMMMNSTTVLPRTKHMPMHTTPIRSARWSAAGRVPKPCHNVDRSAPLSILCVHAWYMWRGAGL